MNFKNTAILISFLAWMFMPLLSRAQSAVIMGKVTDAQSNEELMGAVVQLTNTAQGSITEFDGSFVINDVQSGKYDVKCSYFSYAQKTEANISVLPGDTIRLEIKLEPTVIEVEEVVIVARANREAENVLLLDRRKSMTASRTVGAAEMSRKGIGDAEAAVASVAGVSKQEKVKNVFVRGLGDRYNLTLLNGLPVPSEDPEYRNISLSFFESDVIQNIEVEKVFSVSNPGDAGGAIIDINSRQLQDDYAFGFGASTGFNTRTAGNVFYRAGGMNYFGFSSANTPSGNGNIFTNSLDPVRMTMPVNESYRLAGGRKFKLGDNPLSFYAVATHSSEYNFTEEHIRNITTDGTVYQDQTGRKYSGKKNQMFLGNLHYDIDKKHSVEYTVLMMHAMAHYTGEYTGRHAEKYQDAADEMGFLRRQQVNDNRFLTNQFNSKWHFSDRWQLNADASYSRINGNEPDRRENNLSQKADGSYGLTGGNNQKRFYSTLQSDDFNAKLTLSYKFAAKNENEPASIDLGYINRTTGTGFEAQEFSFSSMSGSLHVDRLVLDDLYNEAAFKDGRFEVIKGKPYSYDVSNFNNSIFVNGNYTISSNLSGMLGVKYDLVNMDIRYDVPGKKGKDGIHTSFFLPSLNLKYNAGENNIIRLGISKTYTLPQSKEISPYQYVNIGYTSEGNAALKHSDNYNFDLKWDFHLSTSELFSAAVFYKRIFNPIGRVDKGNSAGILTYDNISKHADVQGVEFELRKDLFVMSNAGQSRESRLSFGANLSLIHTRTELRLLNTALRVSALEGASPLILQTDISYRLTTPRHSLRTSLVFNYFSDRIFTLGTVGYEDVIEEAVPALDFVISGKLGNKLTLQFKAANLLDPGIRLTRKATNSTEPITLSKYHKGMNLSIGLSVSL